MHACMYVSLYHVSPTMCSACCSALLYETQSRASSFSIDAIADTERQTLKKAIVRPEALPYQQL